MVICLERGADLHIAQLMPLPLTVSCFSIGFTIWYRLTRVVLDKGPLNRCVCVCVSFSALYQSDKTAGSYYCAVVSFYFLTFSLSLSLLSFFPLFSLFLICFYFSFIRLFFSFFGHSPFLPFCLLPLSVYSNKEVGEVDVACYWLVKLEYFEC